jgi:hypothetical protein
MPVSLKHCGACSPSTLCESITHVLSPALIMDSCGVRCVCPPCQLACCAGASWQHSCCSSSFSRMWFEPVHMPRRAVAAVVLVRRDPRALRGWIQSVLIVLVMPRRLGRRACLAGAEGLQTVAKYYGADVDRPPICNILLFLLLHDAFLCTFALIVLCFLLYVRKSCEHRCSSRLALATRLRGCVDWCLLERGCARLLVLEDAYRRRGTFNDTCAQRHCGPSLRGKRLLPAWLPWHRKRVGDMFKPLHHVFHVCISRNFPRLHKNLCILLQRLELACIVFDTLRFFFDIGKFPLCVLNFMFKLLVFIPA